MRKVPAKYRWCVVHPRKNVQPSDVEKEAHAFTLIQGEEVESPLGFLSNTRSHQNHYFASSGMGTCSSQIGGRPRRPSGRWSSEKEVKRAKAVRTEVYKNERESSFF